MDVQDRLKQGIQKFHTEIFPDRREAYERAASQPQRPHTLLITCADSRIDPELITQSGPGEVFVARNIGNLIPPHGEALDGASAVLEYAISALKVEHLVICGHTDCGAMKALLHPESLQTLPVVRDWLRNAESPTPDAREVAADPDPLMNLTKQNVLMQLAHARTHPSVADALAHGALRLSGWIYRIATGDVLMFDETARTWEAVG